MTKIPALRDAKAGILFFKALFSANSGKALFQVLQDIVDMFCPDGETDCVRFNSACKKFFFGKLRMRRGSRVNYQRFYIRHIGEQRKQRQALCEFFRFRRAAFDLSLIHIFMCS